jgi:hypothetical protein
LIYGCIREPISVVSKYLFINIYKYFAGFFLHNLRSLPRNFYIHIYKIHIFLYEHRTVVDSYVQIIWTNWFRLIFSIYSASFMRGWGKWFDVYTVLLLILQTGCCLLILHHDQHYYQLLHCCTAVENSFTTSNFFTGRVHGSMCQ